MTSRVGIPLVEGINKFMDGDYKEAVSILGPIIPELMQKIQVRTIHP